MRRGQRLQMREQFLPMLAGVSRRVHNIQIRQQRGHFDRRDNL